MLPDALRTEDVCLEAVRENGKALKWVPDTLKTPALCLEAARCGPEALRYAPQIFLEHAVDVLLTEDRSFLNV